MIPDYGVIPEHCRGGMKRYIEHGILPGSFLQAIICNDLVGAAGKADDINVFCLINYANFLYNHMPSEAWGSKERMLAWEQKHIERRKKDGVCNYG